MKNIISNVRNLSSSPGTIIELINYIFKYSFLAGRGGRKLDDVRDKYQKACRKLHLSHNEYVLAIGEAIEVEKDFRTSLLPGLLEHQQTLQETYIQTWYVYFRLY